MLSGYWAEDSGGAGKGVGRTRIELADERSRRRRRFVRPEVDGREQLAGQRTALLHLLLHAVCCEQHELRPELPPQLSRQRA